MEAYQRELEGLAGGLETAYAPTSAEQANVLRRYGISGQVGGPRQLYEELDPEFAGLYRQRALEELQQPDIRYKESVGDILARIEEEAAGGAVGRGIYGSGLHAQDYSKRALQTLVPFRMQAITNALNRGEQLAKTLELMRAQAVGEYEPVREREVRGKELGASYRAGGAGARYGTEEAIAGGNVARYNQREAAMLEFLGKVPGAIAAAAGYPGVGAALSGQPRTAPTTTRASGRDPLQSYYEDMSLETPSFYNESLYSPEMLELARQRTARERTPYGRREY